MRDSITRLVPFAIINLKKTDGSEKVVRFWPIETGFTTINNAEYVHRYLTDYNNGEAFMLTQHTVFGTLFRGYSFFYK